MALWSGKAFHNFSMQRLPFLYFGPSPLGGRGVFTARDITPGALIEICPVLVLPAEELAVIHGTRLHDYYFLWGEDQQQCAIALGFGSLYNHASDPNAETVIDYEKETEPLPDHIDTLPLSSHILSITCGRVLIRFRTHQ